MPRNVSALFRRAVQAQYTPHATLLRMKLTHASFGVKRFVLNNENITSEGLVWQKAGLDLNLLNDTNDDAVVGAQFVIANVDQGLISEIETLFLTQAPAKRYMLISISVVPSGNLDSVEISLDDMQARVMAVDARVIIGQLEIEKIDSEGWPYDTIDPANFPGTFGMGMASG